MEPALNRHAIKVLGAARDYYDADGHRIAASAFLTDAERRLLGPLIRQWSVRLAAARLSPMRYAELPLTIAAAATCLLAPAAAVGMAAHSALTGVDLLVASAVYLCIFAVVSVAVFRFVGARLFARLGLLGGALCATATLVLIAWSSTPWRAVGYGLTAGAVGAVVIAAASQAARVFGLYLWFPLRRRALGSLRPSTAVAARLWFLLDAMEAMGGRWRQPAFRRNLLWWITFTGFWLETRLRLAMWMAGYRGPEFDVASVRYRRAAAYVRGLAWQVMNAGDQAAFDAIHTNLSQVTTAVARGEWDLLPPLPRRSRASRLATVGRRLIAPAVLGTVAVALPYLPGVSRSGPALTSLQVALFVAGRTMKELAGKFNVTTSAVVSVVTRRTWKHVDP